MSQNGNKYGGRLAIPGQIAIQCQVNPGPMAHPAQVQIQNGPQVSLMTFGGLTKLEHVAALVASGRGGTAAEAVVFAQDILAECDRIQLAPKADEPPAIATE